MSLRSYCEENGKRYLLREWDEARNLPLTPETVGHSSMFPAWWRCEQGHLWQTQVRSRAASTTGCPICHAQRLAERRAKRQPDITRLQSTPGSAK